MQNYQPQALHNQPESLQAHNESGINIGKILIQIKEETPHGEFISLIEKETGLKKQQCYNYIRVAKVYGQKSTRVDFSNRVLIELSAPSVPQSARDSAEKEEKLTTKQAKELTGKTLDDVVMAVY